MNFTVQLFLRPKFECISKGDEEEFCLRKLVGSCGVSGVKLLVKFFFWELCCGYRASTEEQGGHWGQ